MKELCVSLMMKAGFLGTSLGHFCEFVKPIVSPVHKPSSVCYSTFSRSKKMMVHGWLPHHPFFLSCSLKNKKNKTKKQLDLHIAPVYETVLIKTSCVPDFWIYNLTSQCCLWSTGSK